MFTTTRRALPFNGTNPRLFRNPIKLTTSSVSHAPAHSSLPCFLRLRGERHRRKQALPTKYDTKYFTTKIPTFMNRRLLRDDLKHEPPHKYDIKYKTPSLPPTTNRLPAFLDSMSLDRPLRRADILSLRQLLQLSRPRLPRRRGSAGARQPRRRAAHLGLCADLHHRCHLDARPVAPALAGAGALRAGLLDAEPMNRHHNVDHGTGSR
ncbi:hypothetical protein BJ546DRAFT_39249, partial [Cryomyces antarcticus]